MFVSQNLHHFHFLLSMFQIFKTQLLCLATGHSSHFLWRNFNFGALWTIANFAIEVDLETAQGMFFFAFWGCTGTGLDSVLHWTEHWTVFCTGVAWAEEQNFRRKKDILSARGVEIETRLRANCNSHVKNRRTTGGERKSLFWELQLYAMEKRSIFVWIACHLNVILTTRLFQILNLFCVFCDEVRFDVDDKSCISSTSSPRSNAFFSLENLTAVLGEHNLTYLRSQNLFVLKLSDE